MEYVQMTLNDWIEMKQKLKQELLGVKQSFVRIGYALRKIEDQRLYEQDGYKSIAEFAKAEYGLEPSTTSRFMSINREYSIDGYSEMLRPEFADLGRSQLEEMLKLPDSDRQMIQPETSREDIRELKRFNKAEPAAGVADDVKQLVEKFYQDNPEILNAVFKRTFDESQMKQFTEIVNPGGNRSYKKGLYFLMMYENRIVIKKFGQNPQDMTWWQFYQMTVDLFGEAAAGDKTWQRYFGEDDQNEESKEHPATLPDHTAVEPEEKDQTDEEVPEEPVEEVQEERNPKEPEINEDIEPEKEVAPAQKPAETLSKTEFPEETEIMKEDLITRIEYIDTLTVHGMAEYFGRSMRELDGWEKLKTNSFWEHWLKAEVDENGREILEEDQTEQIEGQLSVEDFKEIMPGDIYD